MQCHDIVTPKAVVAVYILGMLQLRMTLCSQLTADLVHSCDGGGTICDFPYITARNNVTTSATRTIVDCIYNDIVIVTVTVRIKIYVTVTVTAIKFNVYD